MNYLILTEPDDTHAIVVKLALEKLGHIVRLQFTADQPTKQTNSIFITKGAYSWKSSNDFDTHSCNDYDVVWWRRARAPYLPKNKVHEDDFVFVARENRMFFESITDNISPDAWWINSKDAATKANSKLYQLIKALEVGLNIPATLASNNPQDIRYFLLQNEEQGVIYKPFCSNMWIDNEDKAKISYTSKITFMELPSNKLLQIAPGLYQQEIKKKYELRITCFGNYLVAVKLDSQANPIGKMDWRAIPEKQLKVEPYILPKEIEEKIKQFMQKMNLVFGCLDFIVSEEGEYIFLEVNEQGQFLWIENYNPEIKMLDIFLQFLTNGTAEFEWQPNKTRFNLNEFLDDAELIFLTNTQRHVNVNIVKASSC